jgi:hypothetical protein
MPVIMPKELRSSFKLIHSIIYPKGSIKLLALRNKNEQEQKDLEAFLRNSVQKFKESELSVSYSIIDNDDFNTTLNVSMQSLNVAFFKPNTIFASIDSETPNLSYYDKLLLDTKKNSFGLIIYIPFSSAGLAIEKSINLWMTNIPADWKEKYEISNNDLSTLVSLLICRNWKGNINVHIINNNPALKFSTLDIEDLHTMIRFPKNTSISVKQGSLLGNVNNQRETDINIFNIEEGMNVKEMVNIVSESRVSAIFCADSDFESVLV